MKIEQVAVITYTIRDSIQTAQGFRVSMAKLAAIGFQAVQISGMPQDIMSAEEIVAVCEENGLTICATHEPPDSIRKNPEGVVERLKALGCRYTAFPFPAGVDFSDAESRSALIRDLDQAGAILRNAGLTLTYHNHAIEFYRYDGKSALKHIYDETKPQNLSSEIDTYWVQLGGGDPVKWCRDLEGRLPLLHLKDVGVLDGKQPVMVEIGHGNLDFKSICASAENSGCEWFIVEQDICPGDPFDSLRKSFEYIQANLVS